MGTDASTSSQEKFEFVKAKLEWHRIYRIAQQIDMLVDCGSDNCNPTAFEIKQSKNISHDKECTIVPWTRCWVDACLAKGRWWNDTRVACVDAALPCERCCVDARVPRGYCWVERCWMDARITLGLLSGCLRCMWALFLDAGVPWKLRWAGWSAFWNTTWPQGVPTCNQDDGKEH